MRLLILLFLSASTLILSGVTAHAQSIESLGDLAGGTYDSSANAITSDGNVIVGFANSASGQEAFRWESGTGLVALGDLAGGLFNSNAMAINGDGTIITGQANSASGFEAFRWTSGGGMVGLGDLAGGFFYSTASSISADGTVVVGVSSSTNGFEAFRWTSGGGMVGLGDLAGGSFQSFANGISADGNVIVGSGVSASGSEAFMWTSGGGMVGLGDIAGGSFSSNARAVNSDGTVIVGQGSSASGFEAFRWTSGGGMVGLGDLAGGTYNSSAYAVNTDGTVVVGQATVASGQDAFRWTQATGMESISQLLSDSGVDMTGYNLKVAKGVDSTGDIIVGFGTFGGNNIAFLANVLTAGVTTPDDLAAGLASGIVPVQQVQSAASHGLGQSLFAATQSSALFHHNALSVFNADVSPSSIAPAAGDDVVVNIVRRWAAYAVGSFGIGQNNDTDNTSLNGTTGLMVKLNEGWTVGLGVIGSHNRSDMAYDGESRLNAVGGSLITSYESQDSGLRLYGSAFAAHLAVGTDRHYMNGAGTDVSNGSTSGMGYGLAARGGWEFDAIADTRIMPYGEIQITKTELDSYTETGGAFPATYGSSNAYQATTKLGAQVSYDITPTIQVATRLAWAHRLHADEDGISASTTGFTGTIANASGDKNWGELSIEGGWQATEATRFSAELSGRSGRTEDPAGTVTIGISTQF